MSRDDLLALRLVYDEWAKGNFAAGGELFADDIVFAPFVERTPIHGPAKVNAYMREFLAQWSEFRVEADELIGSGESIVVAERQCARGASSGIETVKAFYAVWTFRDGRVVEVRWEDDRDTALKAAGLARSD